MDAFLVPNIPAAVVTAAQLLVAAVLSWIGLTIYRVSRNPKTTPADGVMLDLGLGLVAVERVGPYSLVRLERNLRRWIVTRAVVAPEAP